MIKIAALIIVLLANTAPTLALITGSTTREPVIQAITPAVNPSPRQIRIAEYFTKIGSPDPVRMSTAVMETSSPRLYAVLSKRESNADPTAVGDHGQSRGATQVKAKHWAHLLHEGKVSKDPVIQLQDTERILEALKREHKGNLRKALNAYGGCTTGTYASKVMAEVALLKRSKI